MKLVSRKKRAEVQVALEKEHEEMKVVMKVEYGIF